MYQQVESSMVKYASDLYIKLASIETAAPEKRVEGHTPTVSQASNRGEVTKLTPEQEASLNAQINLIKSKARLAKKAGIYYEGFEEDLIKEAGLAGFFGNVAGRASAFLGRASQGLKNRESANQLTKAIKNVSRGPIVNRASGAGKIVNPSQLPAKKAPAFAMGGPSHQEVASFNRTRQDARNTQHLAELNRMAQSKKYAPKTNTSPTSSGGRMSGLADLHRMARAYS